MMSKTENSGPQSVKPEDIGYAPNFLTSVALPYVSSKANKTEIDCKSGKTIFTFKAGPFGIPFGKAPRMLLIWAATMLQTNDPCVGTDGLTIFFRDSFYAFARRVDWGAEEAMKHMEDILPRLASLHIDVRRADQEKPFISCDVADAYNASTKAQEAWIRFTPSFLQLLIGKPVPISLPLMRKISRVMTIDLYLFLNRRNYQLRKYGYVRIPWRKFSEQFCNDYEMCYFRKVVRSAADELKRVWTGLRLDTEGEYVVLKKSPLTVKQGQWKYDGKRYGDWELGELVKPIGHVDDYESSLSQQEMLLHKPWPGSRPSKTLYDIADEGRKDLVDGEYEDEVEPPIFVPKRCERKTEVENPMVKPGEGDGGFFDRTVYGGKVLPLLSGNLTDEMTALIWLISERDLTPREISVLRAVWRQRFFGEQASGCEALLYSVLIREAMDRVRGVWPQ